MKTQRKSLPEVKEQAFCKEQNHHRNSLINLSDMNTFYLEDWNQQRSWVDPDPPDTPAVSNQQQLKYERLAKGVPAKKRVKSKRSISLPQIPTIAMPFTSKPTNYQHQAPLALIPVSKARSSVSKSKYTDSEAVSAQNRRLQRQYSTEKMIVKQIKRELLEKQTYRYSTGNTAHQHSEQQKGSNLMMIVSPNIRKQMEEKAEKLEQMRRKVLSQKFEQNSDRSKGENQTSEPIQRRKPLSLNSISEKKIAMRATEFQISLKRQVVKTLIRKGEVVKMEEKVRHNQGILEKQRRRQLIKTLVAKSKSTNGSSIKKFIELKKDQSATVLKSVRIKGKTCESETIEGNETSQPK